MALSVLLKIYQLVLLATGSPSLASGEFLLLHPKYNHDVETVFMG